MKNSATNTDFISLLTLSLPRINQKEAYARLSCAMKVGGCTKVYTPNPQMALCAYDSPSFAGVLARADLLLPDGFGLVLASRLRGTPLPERIAGIDAGKFVLKEAERCSLSVAFVGARPGVAAQAAKVLRREYPRLCICYTHHGYFEHDGKENEAMLDALRAAKPDILFLCLGSPVQEIWIDRYVSQIPSLRLCMGLGGSLDVWAGNVRRAPRLIRACGFEWLWRVAREPHRARIFFDIPRFLFLVLRPRSDKKAVANQK